MHKQRMRNEAEKKSTKQFANKINALKPEYIFSGWLSCDVRMIKFA